jgi:hypothetical protein
MAEYNVQQRIDELKCNEGKDSEYEGIRLSLVNALKLQDNCPLNYLERKAQNKESTEDLMIMLSKEQGEKLIKKAQDNPKLAIIEERMGFICITWNTKECGRELIILKEISDRYILARQKTNTNAKVNHRIPRRNHPIKQLVLIK